MAFEKIGSVKHRSGYLYEVVWDSSTKKVKVKAPGGLLRPPRTYELDPRPETAPIALDLAQAFVKNLG